MISGFRSAEARVNMPPMSKLVSMRVLVAVVEERGLAAAARSLDMRPSAAMRALDELEARLGVSLLDRTPGAERVTDVGLRFAEEYRRILDDLRDVELTMPRLYDPAGSARSRRR
ncbi:LysR family transcriptional regulator [Paucibacter sp. R3-3]|uniref:LysR family transcriptional regulator n=1 Tax=Roseateles agri TaxID=3098619 RepID=A0ABU5DKU3_9BURK|nr:LysR family transcriptional regulator [Paucibacter sp. R3-3]MDY0746769.1 LysR family transcriptional regulator [Paucibacter sp. R3-3]